MRGDVAEGVNLMCNLSDYVEERATRRGMERGMQQGMEQGLEQGMERGERNKLAQLVLQNLGQGRNPEEFAGYLGLTADEVRAIGRAAADHEFLARA